MAQLVGAEPKAVAWKLTSGADQPLLRSKCTGVRQVFSLGTKDSPVDEGGAG